MSSGANEQADGVGRLLAGRYRVVEQLGRGGMGVVWRAVDEVLHREVALKELRTYTDAAVPELADLGLRMQREARAAARVRHPGVVAVHDVAEVDGRPLIVMELVDGPSMDDVLRDRGLLDPREAAAIGAKVMDALAAAHRVGVLHRDVKPGNILLDRSGRVVLTDFGIATMENPGDGSATHLTRSGELVGSLDYLAPERAQGNDPGPASDVWALGATLYAAVEGTSPFRRTSTWSTLTAIVGDPLPEPRRAGALGPVLRQLMDKRPEARPDADGARRLLEAVASGDALDTATPSPAGPTPRPRQETERGVPSVPPGFGPATGAGAGAGAAPGFGPPQPAAGHATGASPAVAGPAVGGPQPPVPASGAATTVSTPGARRRKGRALLSAVAVTVVLAATGVTVALLDSGDDTKTGAQPSTTDTADPSEGPSRGSLDLSDGSEDKGKEKDAKKSAGPSEQAKKDDEKKTEASPSPSENADGDTTGGSSGGSDSTGGSTGGGTATGGTTDGGGSSPEPSCHSIGGGKYNCTVWTTAKSYTASGTEVGVLNQGTNYFYCQQNLGRRETYGEWTNVWWAKTDDDSGNTNVFISDVYIKGGDNDAPVPGLPVC
ncbi:protein kinase [Streptomyces ipomoeae]|uniref:serine/threonine-protein kinase n=2 Tax=Streptomyces ipomoeae TaxID=103232 RepID=UPI0029A6A00A|nr:protein kinase [Streptomyces ipomoeae]MDX2696458.1 protein kinase [Streptomyces ipomoeae]MDX2822756.1 protein kinase [Streptomyces ipomoeae]MDX2839025.1 protein kinase [Streptomyces ipomoeae]MDX2873605.1 protein kinase [Streptomyces ipomoeae]